MVIPVHEKIILCGRLIDVASGRLVTGDVVSGAAVNDVVVRRIVIGVTEVVAAKGDVVGKVVLNLEVEVGVGHMDFCCCVNHARKAGADGPPPKGPFHGNEERKTTLKSNNHKTLC